MKQKLIEETAKAVRVVAMKNDENDKTAVKKKLENATARFIDIESIGLAGRWESKSGNFLLRPMGSPNSIPGLLLPRNCHNLTRIYHPRRCGAYRGGAFSRWSFRWRSSSPDVRPPTTTQIMNEMALTELTRIPMSSQV